LLEERKDTHNLLGANFMLSFRTARSLWPTKSKRIPMVFCSLIHSNSASKSYLNSSTFTKGEKNKYFQAPTHGLGEFGSVHLINKMPSGCWYCPLRGVRLLIEQGRLISPPGERDFEGKFVFPNLSSSSMRPHEANLINCKVLCKCKAYP
jgi:hypothetical protein